MNKDRKDILNLTEQPQLFQDYLKDFSKVSDFFVWHPQEDLEKCAQARLWEYPFRDKMTKILREQNETWNAGPSTMKNINKLGNTKTLAVVTGQQAGIFGGPLYTIYKIIQCIKTVAFLEKRYQGLSCVPVFWMEVGDSDYREINHIHLLTLKNELIQLSLPDDSEDKRSVYLRALPEEVLQIHERLISEFPQNDFRDEILNNLKSVYAPGKNLADAFAEWIHIVLKEYGVIIFNPTVSQVAELCQPLLAKALSNWHQINTIFETRSQELQNRGYHNQISLDSQQTLLFYRDEHDRRCRIDGAEKGAFILKGSEGTNEVPGKFLHEEINQSTARFTPNVAFRPIVQDYILPSLIYIGGPAEISYAAQLSSLYAFFEVTPAVFHPRIRATLIEEKIDRSAEKLNLQFTDLFIQRKNILDYKLNQMRDKGIDNAFNSLQAHIENEMKKIGELLIKIDPTLEVLVGKTRQNMQDSLDRLDGKVRDAYQRRMQTEINQLNKVLVNLFPDDKFQERIFNITQYLVKYGPEFIPNLFSALDVENWDHQLIYL